MSTTYAQKQTPAPKKETHSAASVLDVSSPSKGLQRKADLINKTIQCYGATPGFMRNHVGQQNARNTSIIRGYHDHNITINSVITDDAFAALTLCQYRIDRNYRAILGVPCLNTDLGAGTTELGNCIVWVDCENYKMFHISDNLNFAPEKECEYVQYPHLHLVFPPLRMD